jgi:methylated-DNA-[protein]-cysteine S-methyltransferase
MEYSFKKMSSPIGTLTLMASDKGLVAILWADFEPKNKALKPMHEAPKHPALLEVERQLKAYFEGTLESFSLPLDFIGTAFQKQVWAALMTIPYGETRSYAQIAQQIGSPKAVRAVGAANGKNPIPIIAPCHRVIGANGTLTGFAGGLKTKAFLLELESKTPSLIFDKKAI